MGCMRHIDWLDSCVGCFNEWERNLIRSNGYVVSERDAFKKALEKLASRDDWNPVEVQKMAREALGDE